jgi:pyruvate dehydrogenase E1 component alpha subunit/2-oxoisovalerate dehydrogenase E1 component alpha subunit
MFRVLDPDGVADPAFAPGLSHEELRAMYRAMALSRALDGRMLSLQRQGRIGFYGTATGEEAAVVGSVFAARQSDWIFPALRQGAALLLRGFPLSAYIAQLMGNSADVLEGHQMPCHFADRGVNVVAWSSCIGTQLPHAVGAAWAARYQGDDMVALAYLGDGATSEGDFHAAMNFAGVWKAPVVFLCQNNQFAISVPLVAQTASPTLAVKAIAYGMPGVQVDGNDVLAVYRATHEAIDRARAGEGPTFIEAVTFRMGGHSSSDDPTRYRENTLVETWAARDPLVRFRRHLERVGVWSAAQESALAAELDEEITQAIRAAESAPPPSPATVFTHVYAETPWHIAEQRAQVLGERDRERGPGGAFPL